MTPAQQLADTVSEQVGHIARGCLASTPHQPYVYQRDIDAALAALVALAEKGVELVAVSNSAWTDELERRVLAEARAEEAKADYERQREHADNWYRDALAAQTALKDALARAEKAEFQRDQWEAAAKSEAKESVWWQRTEAAEARAETAERERDEWHELAISGARDVIARSAELEEALRQIATGWIQTLSPADIARAALAPQAAPEASPYWGDASEGEYQQAAPEEGQDG